MTWDRETIIVVDDNFFMRQLLVDMLHTTGVAAAQIRSFASGAEAHTFLHEEACTDAIVICDMAMQADNGSELYENLRAKAPRLKFVCLSTVQQLARSDQPLLDCEALKVLEEPFTPAALVDAVQKVTNEK